MANRLVAAKVEADTLVLVSMDRSCELMVTLLAILKAGGAFVVVDKSLPRAQRDALLKRAERNWL